MTRPRGYNLVGLLLLSMVAHLFAEEQIPGRMPTLQVGVQTYTNVIITGKTATDLFIRHAGGMANVKLRNLDPEMQIRFGYDPKDEMDWRKKLTQGAGFRGPIAKNTVPSNSRTTPKAPLTAPVAKGGAPAAEIKPAEKVWAKRLLNTKAPALVVDKWLNIQPRTQGKFIMLVFLTTTDPECQKAIPQFNQIQKKFGDRMAVIGVTSDREEEIKAQENISFGFFVALDVQAKMRVAIDVTVFPHVIIIDPTGIVRWEGPPFSGNIQVTDALLQAIFAVYSR
jgi:cytochrome c biogenesis protein CcmG/thiol:disulfide interchange protein DsbE